MATARLTLEGSSPDYAAFAIRLSGHWNGERQRMQVCARSFDQNGLVMAAVEPVVWTGASHGHTVVPIVEGAEACDAYLFDASRPAHNEPAEKIAISNIVAF